MRNGKWVGCAGIKALPAKHAVKAARHAIGINPCNRPVVNPVDGAVLTVPDNAGLMIQHLALQTSKYWGPEGVHLTVSFMERTAAALQDKILAEMNAWSAYAN